jgi:hypothetical protein
MMDEAAKIFEQNRLQGEAYKIWDKLFNHLNYFAYFNHPKTHVQTIDYLKYGSAKRIHNIFDNIRWLTINIPVNRKHPLSTAEVDSACMHLNSIYLHIRGCLDNFAWALLWQIAPTEAENFNRKENCHKVGLFKKSILGKLSGTSLKGLLEGCIEWEQDFKMKRDPVAHRLPLFIPPQILRGESEANRYKELNKQIMQHTDEFGQKALQESRENIKSKNFDEIVENNKKMDDLSRKFEKKRSALYTELQSIGVFVPYFGYSTREDLIPLYPTIIEDCNQLIKITDGIRAFFENRLK